MRTQNELTANANYEDEPMAAKPWSMSRHTECWLLVELVCDLLRRALFIMADVDEAVSSDEANEPGGADGCAPPCANDDGDDENEAGSMLTPPTPLVMYSLALCMPW